MYGLSKDCISKSWNVVTVADNEYNVCKLKIVPLKGRHFDLKELECLKSF